MSSYVLTLFHATCSRLAYHLPILLLCFVFVILAFVRRGRHPRISLLAVLGLGTFMLTTVVGDAYTAWAIEMAPADGRTVAESANYLGVGGMVLASFQLVSLGVTFSTIFLGRARPFQRARFDDPYSPLPNELTRPAPHAAPDDAYRGGYPPT